MTVLTASHMLLWELLIICVLFLILVIKEVVVLLLQSLLFSLISTFLLYDKHSKSDLTSCSLEYTSFRCWLWHFETITPLWKEISVTQRFLMLQMDIHGTCRECSIWKKIPAKPSMFLCLQQNSCCVWSASECSIWALLIHQWGRWHGTVYLKWAGINCKVKFHSLSV